jgi:hypothetical protein
VGVGMQKGINLESQNRAIETYLLKSHNCKILWVKTTQLKLKGPKSHDCKTWSIKIAFKPKKYVVEIPLK